MMMRAIHAAHRTFADQLLDHVLPAERLADQRIDLGEHELAAIVGAVRELRAIRRPTYPTAADHSAARRERGGNGSDRHEEVPRATPVRCREPPSRSPRARTA